MLKIYIHTLRKTKKHCIKPHIFVPDLKWTSRDKTKWNKKIGLKSIYQYFLKFNFY